MSGEKILLIEDDFYMRDLYLRALLLEGYNALSAEDGEEGLKLCQENTDAQMILLDIMIPKLNGIEVLKQLKANTTTQSMPVVLLTNMTDEGVVQEAMNLGAYAYLIKVRFTPRDVVEKVKELLSSAKKPTTPTS